MNLTRWLFLRIRRQLRRRSPHRRTMHPHPHPTLPRERSAQPIRFARWILGLATLAALVFVVSGCATTTTRVITTDKAGTVTETVTTTQGSDANALALAGQIATAYSPRGIIIREEKSTRATDLQRILRGRPITKQEIANRWRPAPTR